MVNETRILSRKELCTEIGTFSLILSREDFSAVYPGMIRYCCSLIRNGRKCLVFRTNTFEYSPGGPLAAEKVSRDKLDEWERLLQEEPEKLVSFSSKNPRVSPRFASADVVILQGSPRGDGNCSTIAGWVADAARATGKTVLVLFPDDLAIHFCIGCYQCFNSGNCTFNDDMEEVLYALVHAQLLVICTPVYTHTVPAGLKTVLDRALSFSAALHLGMVQNSSKGLLFSVAGRKGESNFTCTRRVVRAFMETTGIMPAGELLFDDMDRGHDIRSCNDAEPEVKSLVRITLGKKKNQSGL